MLSDAVDPATNRQVEDFRRTLSNAKIRSHPTPRAATGHAVDLATGRDNPRVSELHVREYEPRDADALRGLHGRALRETENACPAAGGEFLVGEPARDASDREAGGDDTPIVAMGGLQPATAVDHHEAGAATGVLRRMRVDPAPTSAAGTDARCSKRWSHALATRDIDWLVLDTTPRQAAAMAPYESAGYAETRRESTSAGEIVFYAKTLGE